MNPIDTIAQPTAEQCNDNTQLGDGIYACWYPQMGGYVSHCVVMINPEQAGCFEAFVWHNGEFPFNDGSGSEQVRHIHHCDAQQFIDFASFIKSKQEPIGYTAKSFMGIATAIEWHPDGSVTLCKEVAELVRNGDTSLLAP